ncbi:MAG: transposase [Turicibacter sp.]|jgi:IS5 family transposase|nr:transposase [Turicibacter sp.]
MYRKNNQIFKQLSIFDFHFPYGDLNPNNRWVKLSELIPWHEIEDLYAEKFVNNGHPASDVRIVVGTLILKQKLNCSDVELVEQVKENPYLQFFLGAKEYSQDQLFGASTLVDFRHRLGEDPTLLERINQLMIPKKK